jgi:sarcosine oxidase
MFDVIVLGLGGMGSAAAYHLAARGQRVLGLDRYTAAHDRGSSHGGSRIIRQAYHEHPQYVPLVQRAYELWEKLERDSGVSLLDQTGGLMIGPPGSPVVEGTIRSATEHRLPHDILTATELQRRYPAFRPRPNDTAVFETRAGFLRPERAVKTHLHLAASSGADLHFEEAVIGWSASPGGGVRVTTSLATYEAGTLVIAPGAWAPDVLNDLQIPFDVRRQVMCWFQPVGATEAFLPDQFPVYIYDVDGHDVFYGFPATDGVDGGIKAAMHTPGERCTADTVHRGTSETDASGVRRHLSTFLPELNGPLLRASTCLYTLTPDEHFVVARHPEHPQVSVAAGFSGHGFKFVPVIGEILADLTVNGRTRHSVQFLAPTRFSTIAR